MLSDCSRIFSLIGKPVSYRDIRLEWCPPNTEDSKGSNTQKPENSNQIPKNKKTTQNKLQNPEDPNPNAYKNKCDSNFV